VRKKIKRTIKYLVPIAIIAVAVLYYMNRKPASPEYTTIAVKRGELVQTVSETGTVKAAEKLELRFAASGRIASTSVKTGNIVKEGQILAVLDLSSLNIEARQASAGVREASAQYDKLKNGATPAELKVARANMAQSAAAYDRALKEKDASDSSADKAVKQAQKNLDDLQDKDINTTFEQAIAQAQTALDSAESTYSNALKNRRDSALTAISDKTKTAGVALDAIKTILENDTDGFKKAFSAENSGLKDNTADAYALAVDAKGISSTAYAAAADKSEQNVKAALEESINYLKRTANALFLCFQALENTVVSKDFSRASLDSYKTSISGNLTAVNAGEAALEAADQAYKDAILAYRNNTSSASEALKQSRAAYDAALISSANALDSARSAGDKENTAAASKVESARKAKEAAQAELDKISGSANFYDLAAASARIETAKAALEAAQKRLADSQITAPIKGTITDVAFDPGEYVSPANVIITMQGEDNLEVIVDTSEADIEKVRLEDPAEITFDAFGEDRKIIGKVYFIDPAETVIQDVVYYRTKVMLYTPQEIKGSKAASTSEDKLKDYAGLYAGIKPGMTANVVITTAKKSDVLIIPARAIVEKTGGEKAARVLVNGKLEERPAVLGLRGDEGMVEILSGVNEGENAVTFVKEPGK
jgi:HlyD family secretion protein